MKLIKVLLICIFCMTLGSVEAQKSRLKKANMMYENLAYEAAIPIYLGILDKNDNSEAKIKLADCYRKIGNTAEAEYWYGQVVRLPEAEPVHKMYYAQSLQTNGKCDQAKQWYEEYAREVPGEHRGTNLLSACDAQDELMSKNGNIYTVRHLPFNTVYDDFGTAYFKDGIVYASERQSSALVERVHCWTGFPFLELFYVGRNAGESDACEFDYKKAEKFSPKLNTKFHDAAMMFTKDEKTIYFTRNNLSNGKIGRDDNDIVRLKIYTASFSDGKWSEEQGLPFNSDEYSVAHPALNSAEDRLYFASDMPGGFGGMDLYVSKLEGGRWSPAENLGPSVNTEGHEVFPHVDERGRLYFSSDSHTGLGGLDVFYMDDNSGVWGPVINMGYPINTSADDFGLVLNEGGDCGYLSSDREGGAGRDDIYSFRKDAVEVDVYVYDELTNEPIEGAEVKVDCNGTTLVTGPDGKARTEIGKSDCCEFMASKDPDYLENSKKACASDVTLGENLMVEIPLRSPIEFKLEGIAYDAGTNQPLEGVEILVTPDCDQEPFTIVTGPDGSYSFDMLPNCCYTLSGKKETYRNIDAGPHCTNGLTESTTLPSEMRLSPIQVVMNDPPPGDPGNRFNGGTDPGTGGTTTPGSFTPNSNPFPVSPGYTGTGGWPGDANFNPAPPIVNDACCNVYNTLDTYVDASTGEAIPFLLNIYYDFNSSSVRSDANSELEKLYNLLSANRNLVVEIGSHTDARGSSRYNKNLSQRRAESVVGWLVDRGLERSQLKARGYGETQNVNNCADNVPCSEEEHQMNRRTEFRIIGMKDGQNYQESSQTPSSVRTDPCVGCPF